MKNWDIAEVAKQFCTEGIFFNAHVCGTGHINDTFKTVFDKDGTESSYIIQRINHNVFKEPETLMDNMVRVTEHIRGKLQAENADDIFRKVLTIIPARNGSSFYRDATGNYWRCFNFIENARTYDICRSPEHLYESARAFGEFENYLIDLPGPGLHETIPDFHNGPKRFMAFQAALKKNECNRAKSVKKEIDFLLSNGWIFDVLPKLVKENKIPLRITHNDAKINNIMFDNTTLKAICVIDLDTVMPGMSLYDFGDIVRTTISDAAEDEPDLSRVTIDLLRFEAIVTGYLSKAGEFLNKTEITHLVHGSIMITLIMGARFLTDYLMGDVYYKIHRPEHNLDRCRAQFRLVEQMLQWKNEMERIIEKYNSF